jgi:hypothetical protein
MTEETSIVPIDHLRPVGLNLIATYWTPAAIEEKKRLLFYDVRLITHVDNDTGEERELPTAVFVDPVTKEVIHQASARLVGAFQKENPVKLTPFEIIYKGKQKNATNQFSSDSWAIYRLAETP